MSPKELKKLQKQWYQKLKATGFEDIEEFDSPRQMLKRWAKQDFLNMTDAKIEERRLYYQEADYFLEWYTFTDPVDKIIWELHAAGKTVREIEKLINLAKSSVHLRINKMKREMLRLN